jgi:anti-anti-sigma regulatory factor
MAKYRHRIFEMYDFRDEAAQAIAPRSEKLATEATAPESWTFTHLDVSRSAGVTLVQFKEQQSLGEETFSDLRDDFLRLADKLGRDSKVLVDFTGVTSFSAAAIDALALFNQKLQTKGSRIALCSLDPATRESFFVAR